MNANHKIKKEGSKLPKYNGGALGTIDLRNKLMNRFKSTQEIELERQKNRVKKVRNSGILGLALKGGRSRSPSINTISSDDSVFNSNPKNKKKKARKKMEGATSSSSSSEDGTFIINTQLKLMNDAVFFCRSFTETFHRYDPTSWRFSYV